MAGADDAVLRDRDRTLVSDLSKPLRENASLAECKRVHERVSGWLANYDFVEDTGGCPKEDGRQMMLEGF